MDGDQDGDGLQNGLFGYGQTTPIRHPFEQPRIARDDINDRDETEQKQQRPNQAPMVTAGSWCENTLLPPNY
jgi:hypothetical protein